MPTAPSVPKRSPIQVLSWHNVAKLQWSNESSCFQLEKCLRNPYPEEWTCQYRSWEVKKQLHNFSTATTKVFTTTTTVLPLPLQCLPLPLQCYHYYYYSVYHYHYSVYHYSVYHYSVYHYSVYHYSVYHYSVYHSNHWAVFRFLSLEVKPFSCFVVLNVEDETWST